MRLIVLLVVPLLAAVVTAQDTIYGNGTIFFTYARPVGEEGVQVVYRPEGAVLDIVSQQVKRFKACITFEFGYSEIPSSSTYDYIRNSYGATRRLSWSSEGQYFYMSKDNPALIKDKWVIYEVKIYNETYLNHYYCYGFSRTTPFYVDTPGAYKVPEEVGYCDLEKDKWTFKYTYSTNSDPTKCSLVLNGSSLGDFYNSSRPLVPRIYRVGLFPYRTVVIPTLVVIGVIILLLLVVAVQKKRNQTRRRPDFPMTNRLPTQENDNLPPLTTRVPTDTSYGLPSYEDLPDANLPPDYEEAAMLPDNVSLAETKT